MRYAMLSGAFALTLAAMAAAAPLEQSLRPLARGVSVDKIVPATAKAAPKASLRPATRPASVTVEASVPPETHAAFASWVRGFRNRAGAAGISASVLDAAFADVRYQPSVVARDSTQSEFTKTLWQYLASAVSDSRIETGRARLAEHAGLLDLIEQRYGVEKEVVLAIWGMESAYGSFRGTTRIVPALATLAFDGRRGAFFEDQLLAALRILQNGDIGPDQMTGSWAGAMGHTQFIPTSYEALAVDFTGDGRRDIWSDDPADALASTANYLARSGWTKGQPWGVEVRLPPGFDYTLANPATTRLPSDWRALGVTDMAGRPVPDHAQAAILLPAGARGAAFMVFPNFRVIKRYNAADAYAIGVGHLSDRISGAPPIQSGWPDDARGLTREERMELQRRLSTAGFNPGGIDGRIGPNTLRALRAYQRSKGLVADGYASLSLLERMR